MAPKGKPATASGALAQRSSSGLDKFEREYMSDGSPVVYRERVRAAPWMLAVYGVASLGAFVQLFTGAALSALPVFVVMALLYVSTSVLRVTVTQTSVFVRLALWGPTIPLSAIDEVETFRYSFWEYGGWGVRHKIGKETMYNVPGDAGRAVRIRWTDDQGRARTTAVGTRRAQMLAEEIEAARAAYADSSAALPPGDE